MAFPVLASLALLNPSLPAAAPAAQLFSKGRIELPSLALGSDQLANSPLIPLPFNALPAPAAAGRRHKLPPLTSLMPILNPPLLDPGLIHAPKDQDIDYKLIVKEVKLAEKK